MKSSIASRRVSAAAVLAAATVSALLALAACSRPITASTQTPAATDGWAAPPRILSVAQGPSSLIFQGQAQPGGRVVLRSAGGDAYAAAADARGRFEIRMPRPAGDLMLFPEAQNGQDAAPSPERLLIVGGGRGPIALLTPGGAARRVDAASALGAIDSDGRVLLASGRAGRAVTLSTEGDTPRQATPAADGRWTLALAPSGGPVRVTVDGVLFDYPGGAPGSGPLPRVERAGLGWRVAWPVGDGAQVTWLPDAPA